MKEADILPGVCFQTRNGILITVRHVGGGVALVHVGDRSDLSEFSVEYFLARHRAGDLRIVDGPRGVL